MNRIDNIGQELDRFLAETSDEEILKLWNQCAREEYEGTITVSEYMDAIGHMVEEPIVETASIFDVAVEHGIAIYVPLTTFANAIVHSSTHFYQLHISANSSAIVSNSTQIAS